MKLGSSKYGLSDNLAAIPTMGSGATICSRSDRRPATVIDARRTKKGKLVIAVQYDFVVVADCNRNSRRRNSEGERKYSYFPNPDGPIVFFKQHKNHVLSSASLHYLILGHRDMHDDFS